MGRIYLCPCFQKRMDHNKRLSLFVLFTVVVFALLTLIISGLLTVTIFKSDMISSSSVVSSGPANLHYGIVIDCGSSGSRIYVYYWPPHSGNPQDLLNIQQLLDHEGKPLVKKVSPGLSSFAEHPSDASDHIKELLLYVQDYIPKEKHKETPLYILATAGMRMLSRLEQEAILKDLQTDITKDFEFLIAENHFEVISGKLEGVYAWIAVNYALDRFVHSPDTATPQIEVKLADGKFHKRSQTVGMIDMGGGSVQIAFEVTDNKQLQHIPKDLIAEFNLGCQETDFEHTYTVYVTTFLEYGANSAIERYQENLTQNFTAHDRNRLLKKKKMLPDPCMPLGMQWQYQDEEKGEVNLIGLGDYHACKLQLEPLLNLSVSCSHIPCSMNGIHQPEIDFSSAQFFGFSEFWYSMEDVFRIGGTYKFSTFEEQAKKFCGTHWSQLEQWYQQKLYPKADEHRFKFQCIKAAWMSVVLHQGFQFPTDYSRFQSAQLISGKDIQWTLGALIYRTRFLPLRDIDQNLQTHPSTLSKPGLFYNEYLIILCFVVVLAAIFLYMKRLRLCPRSTSVSLARVPSMSYFMTEENQMEQGVRYVKGQGYL